VSATLACGRGRDAASEVWAEVDGRPILREQVERHYRGRAREGSEAGSAEQALSFKLSILNELIGNEILLAHASRAGITVSEAEVDKRVAELRSPYAEEEFRRRLDEQGLDDNRFRLEVRQSLVLSKLVNKEITSRLAVTDEEIASYYEQNKAAFHVPERQYHLALIQVTPERQPQVRNLKNDDAQTPAGAERKVKALYARVLAGEDFATVAQEYSEDPRTASGGGDMGFVPESALEGNPPIRQAVRALKPGEVTGILRTENGYHILKLIEIVEPGERLVSDPQVQAAIRRNLLNEKEQLLKTAYLEKLRNKAKVANYLAERIVKSGGGPEGL
jgi:peptidyl-prolyl cis-trans isomerase SurA